MFQVINPYNKEMVVEYAFSDDKTVDHTIEQLYQNRPIARYLSIYERAETLNKLALLLEGHKEPLAKLIVRETGKTITDARVELARAKATAEATAAEIRTLKGETLSSDAYPPKRNRLGIVNWHPLGVVYCITPFNFPINIAIHKIAPAFAAGNTILFKSSEYNYLSGRYLLNLCYEAGIPTEILLGIHPSPDQYVSINADRRLHAINFTGGTQAGTAIASQAGMKPLLMELGGNDPFIVMPDADIESAVDIAIAQRFGTAGQRCTAPKRFFIHQQVKADFIEQLVVKTKQLSVGDPMDDQTFIGPVIHESAACQIHERIKQACYLNAKLLVGGQREGSIVFPTVMDEVPMQADLIAEETFGPVIAMQGFEHLEEVVEKVNRSQYGLQAAVFTQDMQVAQRLYQSLEVGALIVNDGPGFRAEHFPFGGVKASGLGREGVGYAIKAMSYQKLWVI